MIDSYFTKNTTKIRAWDFVVKCSPSFQTWNWRILPQGFCTKVTQTKGFHAIIPTDNNLDNNPDTSNAPHAPNKLELFCVQKT